MIGAANGIHKEFKFLYFFKKQVLSRHLKKRKDLLFSIEMHPPQL